MIPHKRRFDGISEEKTEKKSNEKQQKKPLTKKQNISLKFSKRNNK